MIRRHPISTCPDTFFPPPSLFRAVHPLGPRLLPRVGRLDHPMTLVGMDRLAGPAGRQRPRGVLLPILMLAAYLADLGGTVPLGQRPERGTRLDRLQIGRAHV